MDKANKWVLAAAIFLLAFPFIAESLGNIQIRNFIFLYFLFLPSALYLLLSNSFSAFLKLPLIPTLLSACFIFFSAISSLGFSADKELSMTYLLFYSAALLIAIFLNNAPRLSDLFVKVSVIGLGFFTVAYAVILGVFYRSLPSWLIPQHEFQLVYPSYFGHNHLGDFLGLAIICLLCMRLKKTIKTILIIAVMLLIYFSLTRSALLSLLPVLIFGLVKKTIPNSLGIKLMVALTAILTIATFIFLTHPFTSSSALSRKLAEIRKLRMPYYRLLLSNRPDYFQQAIHSFISQPLFGWGPGNFSYASNRYKADYQSSTVTAHNIFLDILAENGLLAALCLTALLLLAFYSAVRYSTIEGILWLYLLINFQGDYTYRIFSLFLLFLALAFRLFPRATTFNLPTTAFGIASLILALPGLLIITSATFLHSGLPVAATNIYPLNTMAYRSAVLEKEKVGDNANALLLARRLEWITPAKSDTLIFLADFYERNNQREKSLYYLEKAYSANRYVSFHIIEKIYQLIIKKSPIEARSFLDKVLITYKSVPYGIRLNIQQEVSNFCRKENITDCNLNMFP